MKVIYKSVEESIKNAVDYARKNNREIEKIILSKPEWEQFKDEVGSHFLIHCHQRGWLEDGAVGKYEGASLYLEK